MRRQRFHILKRNTRLGYKLQDAGGGIDNNGLLVCGLVAQLRRRSVLWKGNEDGLFRGLRFIDLTDYDLHGVLVESGISPIPLDGDNQIPLTCSPKPLKSVKDGNLQQWRRMVWIH